MKYSIALREGRECHYWLRLVSSDQPGLAQAAAPLLEEVDQLVAILTATVRTLRTEDASSRESAQ